MSVPIARHHARGRLLALVLALVLALGVMPAIGAAVSADAEEQPGAITGVVTTEADVPLPGALVSVWRWEGGYEDREYVGSLLTDENGEYEFSDLAPGAYRMLFGPTEDHVYAFTCFGGVPTLSSSNDVYVTSGATTAGVNAKLPEAAGVAGNVTNPDGELVDIVLGGIAIQPYYLGDSGWEPAPWIADPGETAGTYLLDVLPPGTVRLVAECDTGVFVDEWYADASTVESATDIALVSTETTTADFQLAYAGEAETTQVAGVDRYGTAVEASKKAFPDGAATVVIATGTNWPDALGGSGLAGAVGGPILLVRPSEIPSEVVAEIERLDPVNAIILGGTGAVSEEVESMLAERFGAEDVVRIGGANRYETADLVARAYAEATETTSVPWAIVATGQDFPDALAMSAIAARGAPILLSGPSGLTSATVGVLTDLGVENAIVAGGTGAVSSEVETLLQGMMGEANVHRLAGVNRYETAIAIAEWALDNHPDSYHWNGLAIATGADFPDALAGGVMQAAEADSILLLTPPDQLHSSVELLLDEKSDYIGSVTFLGGTGAVSQDVRDAVSEALLR